MRHRTEDKRIGLAIRGVGGVVAASLITLLLLPEAASEVRAQDSPATPAQREASTSHALPVAKLHLSDKKGLWSDPKGINVTIGRIRVPSIRINDQFRLGVRNTVVRLGPGLWPGTPLPGDAGNAVLAGHRTSFTHPFANLDRVKKGDVIATRVHGQPRTVYKVIRISVVSEAKYKRFVLQQPKHPRARMITLFACTPKGFRTHRIVVRGRASRTPREEGNQESGDQPDPRLIERS